MTPGTASRSIALRFLQTVVVVDDTAYSSELEPPPSPASLGGEELQGATDAVEATDFAFGLDELDPQRFETEAIVEGFANLGMACAVLAPSHGEDAGDEDRLLRLAQRSDVVILDWIIRPGAVAGTEETVDRTSLGLLRKVLRADVDAGGQRIRLICIYTGEADTAKVCDAVNDGLKAEFESTPVTANENVINLGAARVVVLSKERAVPTPGVEAVASRELPSRVVDEFTDLVATGLLPEVALESLSAIRDRAHRVLRRLSGHLDPALLSHRSTTSAADAEQFVLSLVGSELAAIVDAADAAAPLRDTARIETVVKAALAGRTKAFYWKTLTTKTTSEMTATQAEDVLTLKPGSTMDNRASRSSLLIEGDAESVRAAARTVDLGFAALSALSRDCRYEGRGSPAPVLQLGTVLASQQVPPSPDIKETEGTPIAGTPSPAESSTDDSPGRYRYWLCLQPLCDCVRLKRPTRFPMLPLKEPDVDRPGFELAVADGPEYVPLQVAGSKISDFDVKTFVPDPGRKVVLGRWAGDAWEFTAEEGTFVWLGDLRLDKAHRLLHRIVTSGARIGIDEYDFLRRSYETPD